MIRHAIGAVVFVGVVCSLSRAQTSYPMITHITPVAVQRGKTAEVAVDGKMNFAGAHTVLVEGAGVRGEVVTDPKAKVDPNAMVAGVKLKVTAEPDAQLGVREF